MLSKPYFSKLLNLVNAWQTTVINEVCSLCSTYIKLFSLFFHQYNENCTSSNYFVLVQTILSQFKNKLFQSKNWTTTHTLQWLQAAGYGNSWSGTKHSTAFHIVWEQWLTSALNNVCTLQTLETFTGFLNSILRLILCDYLFSSLTGR